MPVSTLKQNPWIDAPNNIIDEAKVPRAHYILPVRYRRIGSIPAALLLGAADLGEAELDDGSIITITWGMNVGGSQQRWWAVEHDVKLVYCGGHGQFAELVIPDDIAKKLRKILTA